MVLTIDDTNFRRPGLRAVLYGRNSHDRYKRGLSVDDQLAEMRAAATIEQWEIVGEYRDVGLSATRHARKARDDWDAMMEKVRTGEVDVLMTWESSRAQRDLGVYVALRDLCHDTRTLWWYTGELYDLTRRRDRNRTALDAVRDEDEGEGIRDRVLRTVRRRAEQGLPHGRIPYGFRRTYDSVTRHFVSQLPDGAVPLSPFAATDDELRQSRAAVVYEIFRCMAAGQSAYSIAQRLNALDIPTPFRNARGWDGVQVVRTAKNPAYIGKRIHQGKIIGDAVWDGFIDEVTWWKVAAIIANPQRRTHKDTAVRHLMSGMAFCGVCGAGVRVTHPYGVLTYSCSWKFCVAIAQHLLDDYVEAAVLGRLERPDAEAVFLAGSGDKQVLAALAEASEKQARLDEARQMAVRGELSIGSLAALESGLLPEIDAARARARSAAIPPALERLVGPRARDVWAELTMAERRMALRPIVKVTVNRTGKGVRTIRPGRIGLEWLTSSARTTPCPPPSPSRDPDGATP